MEPVTSATQKQYSIVHFVFTGILFSFSLTLAYLLLTFIYNVFFHPLCRFPGPKLSAMVRIPYTLMYLSGNAHRRILELHEKYGPVVRVAPEIISISHPEAMKELRSHRKHGAQEHGKDPIAFGMSSKNILGANRQDHTRFRRIMANAFSAQAMQDQQPIIKTHVDRLFEKLKSESAGGSRPLNIVNWYNYTTFDIIGDLAFGESFGCLENAVYHPWVSLTFSSFKNLSFVGTLNRYQLIAPLLKYLVPKELATKWAEHSALSREKVKKRLAAETSRPDIIQVMSQGSKGGEMTFDEIANNSGALIVAGSETTATLLSAATYFLALHPRTLAALTAEVRSSFASEEEIDLISAQKLKYMLAVLDESLRLFPPAASGHPRKLAQGGDTIIGHYFPQDTIIELWHWSLYHNPAYFRQPDDFIPERWLGDEAFAHDKLEAVLPFSVGPRNCIGRNLAYAEMRLILARMVWNFDIKLAPTAAGWTERSRLYILWEKPPLDVYLVPHSNLPA